ncbi:DUF998 domain-containing protein [Aquimarina sp. MMG016]|uniref:DUF998 domain-containing protein n=1 Tax=Aquimarina sp. MMG016 TaxID=2822690 RepID=UPI001B3A6A7A|nr:DUF998 domain-containing protein [Aquimarina sp. MMG016]MBQ4819668.1 DUF998 domain-containing protein [Aquimarina sp. MMG016]
MKRYYSLFTVLYLVMILASFILPFFTAPKYTILENTLSELGAQNTPYNWVMNIIFMALSCITIITGYQRLKGFYLQIILLFVFAISFFLTSVYQHAPINRALAFNSYENELHSMFSTLTGISFCVYSVTISFIAQKRNHKILAILIGIIALVLSYSMFIHSDYRGIYQRVIFILAFGWLLYSFEFYTFMMTKKSILKLLKKYYNER